MRYLCIHGHFYQPPRENPWLETIELQDSAYPYHDWNERITAESYAPNAVSRILDNDQRIRRIVNNYAKISFNYGPTLLSWAKDKAPELYRDILAADRDSIERFSGHGCAIAQAYNHIIMPLANRRDKETQIIWGLEDFKARFGRMPEGMWLAETAVDLESLELLAKHGIKYTILAPSQARAVREIGGQNWMDVSNARIDPTRAYNCPLPSGNSIALFFYDGPISRAVAFEGLLRNGEVFASRLQSAFSYDRPWDQLAHIATDGETYGHHHRHGDMALAYALHHVEATGAAQITNYGEYLATHPPAHDVQIFENTAWSCAHGVGRWSRDCGCNSAGRWDWNQSWREPLRTALDWLRDRVAPLFEAKGGELLIDPWAARNDYIHVVLDRSPATRAALLAKHARYDLTPDEQVTCWKLFELQRHAMLMYTSCGWFFDELTGIETVQVIQYAGRVVQLAEELFGEMIEDAFLAHLARAKSNMAEYGDGARVYEKQVKPAVVDLRKLGAHYAISSLFEPYPELTHIYCYRVERQDYQLLEAGKLRLALGRVRVTSEITQETDDLSFGVIHFGDHNINGGVAEFRSQQEYDKLVDKLTDAFSRADIPEVIRLFDRGFGVNTYSLKSLFLDEQRHIMHEILEHTLGEAEAVYKQLYENHAPLMRFLGELRTPVPKAFQFSAEYTLNRYLQRMLNQPDIELPRVRTLLEDARRNKIDLDTTTLEFTLRKNIERIGSQLLRDPRDPAALHRLHTALMATRLVPFPVTLWTVQNIGYELRQRTYAHMYELAQAGDAQAATWLREFCTIADILMLEVPKVTSKQ